MIFAGKTKYEVMSNVKLEPSAVFECFSEINKVPRPSKREDKMIEFIKSNGEKLGLETHVDEVGNVLIRKPATKGYENRETVVIQSHMDMVCEKNADVEFDFLHDAIQTEIDGEWLKAKGTTLGADDGIGDAMALALLRDNSIEHGPIECLFTRDEETDLTGARGLKPGFMTGRYLLNLDSEKEGEIFISSAGFANTTAEFHVEYEKVPANKYFFFKINISGLTGGHSGDDIEKKRANANKLIARFLYSEMKKLGLRLADIQSGGLHNAIPRNGYAVCAVPMDKKEQVRIDFNIFAADIEEEFSVTEKTMKFDLESCDAQQLIDEKSSRNIITALQAVDNGIYAMSQEIEWLVETSSNLASIHANGNVVTVVTSQRSNINSALANMSATVAAVFELAGAKVRITPGCPGWKLDPNSELLKIAVDSYKRLFGKDPKVLAIHAGLECGLFTEQYPNVDMISFGPTLVGVHSPDEKLLIPTVKKVWDFLLEILKNIPEKK